MKKLQTGFTLLELLLVVVIVSVIASLAVLSVGDRRTKQLHNQAQKLEALLNWLADEAVFQQQPLGLKLTEAGYQQLHWGLCKNTMDCNLNKRSTCLHRITAPAEKTRPRI